MAVDVELANQRPRHPRAPSQEAWSAMAPAERRAAVDALPAWMTDAELAPPEGDAHFDAKVEGRDTLRTYFERAGRRVYVGAELTVYYPDEDRFSPDLFAVCDVEAHPREKWVVSHEDRGLDWVLEVLVPGDRRKDLEANVSRYARPRIPEYFVFDRGRGLLRGWRLADPKIGVYQPMPVVHGALRSGVLGLDLQVERGRLRFRQGSAVVLAPRELLDRLELHASELMGALEEQEHLRAEAEARATETEARATEAEAENARLRAEIERLRRGG